MSNVDKWIQQAETNRLKSGVVAGFKRFCLKRIEEETRDLNVANVHLGKSCDCKRGVCFVSLVNQALVKVVSGVMSRVLRSRDHEMNMIELGVGEWVSGNPGINPCRGWLGWAGLGRWATQAWGARRSSMAFSGAVWSGDFGPFCRCPGRWGNANSKTGAECLFGSGNW